MITIKTEKEIRAMREGGKRLTEIMDKIAEHIVPNTDTLSLDKLAEELVLAFGGTPAFKGYKNGIGKPFPATVCISINEEVVHGIPKENKIIHEGDIVSVDIGMKYQGLHTDMARAFSVGKISSAAQKLIEVTEQSFWEGIQNLAVGKMLSDYSRVVQKYAEANGFSVVRNLVGHGVGRQLHEDPSVPNYYNRKYSDIRLIAGMTLALEPMINEGTSETVLGSDGWVFKTKDGKLSAHYENTVLITEKGVEVLTIL
ncbi:MAG: type I methionyl aminopeptidase [Candidatus Moranbacteria bacterium]|nr:type I methionyl aminopeptidase [Candidatus Moranbacteria bacterium]